MITEFQARRASVMGVSNAAVTGRAVETERGAEAAVRRSAAGGARIDCDCEKTLVPVSEAFTGGCGAVVTRPSSLGSVGVGRGEGAVKLVGGVR